MKDAVVKVIKSGIEPIVLGKEIVRNYSEEILMVRTSLTINSLDLGVLTPNEYRYVARRTSQSIELSKRHIEKLFDAYPAIKEEYPGAECYSVQIYARMLKDGLLKETLDNAFIKYPDVDRDKICVEISADLLFEEYSELIKELDSVREMGVKIALSEVGDEFFPILRLASIDFDIAILDKYAVSAIGTERQEKVIVSLAKFLKSYGVKVIAPLPEETYIAESEKAGCDGYSIKKGLSEALTSSTETVEEKEQKSEEGVAEQ